jgi:hypothetical protein
MSSSGIGSGGTSKLAFTSSSAPFDGVSSVGSFPQPTKLPVAAIPAAPTAIPLRKLLREIPFFSSSIIFPSISFLIFTLTNRTPYFTIHPKKSTHYEKLPNRSVLIRSITVYYPAAISTSSYTDTVQIKLVKQIKQQLLSRILNAEGTAADEIKLAYVFIISSIYQIR